MRVEKQSSSSGVIAEELHPLLPNLFEPIGSDGKRFGLVGGYCTHCDRYFFPLAEQCSDCCEPLTRMIVGERGSVYSYTVVRTKAPFGLPEPYAVAYIDLAESPLRIFGLIDPGDLDDLDVGKTVQLTVKAIGVDALGRHCLRPVFRLADTGAKRCSS
ncbi:MAG: OB-fold domain-containing protein [Desulfuromonadaceae bacterium]|nr:OB-fold domain-containing protein [Desulfuromonadaceae bacterium]